MEMTGARILMEMLQREGVDTLFGFPGGAVIDIYDELARTPIRHILVRHEQGAVHAADGYARATGKVGVCLVTSGPGATNTVTGIATAYMDSIPIVVSPARCRRTLIGNDAFQEADIVGITRPCTKHNYLVKDVNDLAARHPGGVLHRPHGAARTRAGRHPQGRHPGPHRARASRRASDLPRLRPQPGSPPEQVRTGGELADARPGGPLIYAGGGVIISGGVGGAAAARASGPRPPSRPRSWASGPSPADAPALPGHARHARHLRRQHARSAHCDLLIAVGARFDDRVTGKIGRLRRRGQDHPHRHRPHRRSARTSRSTSPSWATASTSLQRLNALLDERPEPVPADRAPGRGSSSIQALEAGAAAHLPAGRTHQAAVRDRADLRAHPMATPSSPPRWARTRCGRPSSTSSTGRARSSPPAAWARWATASPPPSARRSPARTRRVIDIAGDGSIQMNIQELATAVAVRAAR